jgi:hypothetical protein
MSGTDLCHHLQAELGRSREVQPHTLRTWRNGQAAVPLEAMLVVADLVKFRFPGIELLLLGEAIDNEARRQEAYVALVESQGRSRA